MAKQDTTAFVINENPSVGDGVPDIPSTVRRQFAARSTTIED